MESNNTQPYTVVPSPVTEFWWMSRYVRNVGFAHQGNVEVAFYGDSITEWMDPSMLKDFFGPATQRFGIAGDQAQHLLWRLQHEELYFSTPPKVVVILIGTNHIGSNNKLSAGDRHDIFLGIKANVDEIRKRLPETRILLLGLLPREQFANHPIRADIAQINLQAATLADGHAVVFSDVGSSLLEPDGSLSSVVAFDLLHPSALGYHRLFTAIKPEIDRLLQ
jgi:beta-glucosidase